MTPLYWVITGITVFYALAVGLTLALGTDHGTLMLFSYMRLTAQSSALFFCVFVGLLFGYIIAIKRPERLVPALAAGLRDTVFSGKRLLQAIPVLLIFPIFFAIFSSFKYQIPELMPFIFDPFFVAADGFIHGGRQPWEILQPVIGFAVMTFIIGCVYKFWFLTKFCVLYWQAFSTSQPMVRAQFFIATLLTWIINGSLFALLFSSAGPVFFDRLYPDAANPYHDLMAYLRAVNEVLPVWDLPVQEFLWQKYTDNSFATFAGISAFPSIHVSYAFLFLLAARHYGRAYSVFFTAFFIFTLIGSIHLGWHYAIDGYFGILTTWLIWIWSGRLVRRFRLHEPRVKDAKELA